MRRAMEKQEKERDVNIYKQLVKIPPPPIFSEITQIFSFRPNKVNVVYYSWPDIISPGTVDLLSFNRQW